MLRIFAHTISVLFHPLLMLTYGLLFMMWVNPYQFGGISNNDMTLYMIGSIAGISFFFPIFSIVLMRMLGMVESFQMEEREERIIPYISTGIFYLWLSVNIYRTSIFPPSFEIYAIGATLGLFLAFFINNFTKISMHTVGMGGFLAMVIITILSTVSPLHDLRMILLGVIVLTGLVGTARLILHAHEPKEIYGGYLVGFAAQFIALNFLA